jgi:FAD:protein FMN transferase
VVIQNVFYYTRESVTGYPIENAPRSITVAGSSCLQAGTLSTLALLQSENAENFLQEQQALFWCLR